MPFRSCGWFSDGSCIQGPFLTWVNCSLHHTFSDWDHLLFAWGIFSGNKILYLTCISMYIYVMKIYFFPYKEAPLSFSLCSTPKRDSKMHSVWPFSLLMIIVYKKVSKAQILLFSVLPFQGCALAVQPRGVRLLAFVFRQLEKNYLNARNQWCYSWGNLWTRISLWFF